MKSEEEEEALPSWSFFSLPWDIVLSILALIPTSYYPKLSLVSKSFRSIIFSIEFVKARCRLRTREECIFVCLKLPTRHHPFWFSLWIKNTQLGSTRNLLIPTPSSYTPHRPTARLLVGSKAYTFDKHPSSVLWVIEDKLNSRWVKTPRMKVARENTVVVVHLDEKIYVMGGCEPDETTNWGEVFNTVTQTWESLPDPGDELRHSFVKRVQVWKGMLYVISDKKHYQYYPEQGRWEVLTEKILDDCFCWIDNLQYIYNQKKCLWFDTKIEMWKEVKGLDGLDSYEKNGDSIIIAGHVGKLVMFWNNGNKEIWCALITLEKRHGDDDEVWGLIEWVDVVLEVPGSSTLLQCATRLV